MSDLIELVIDTRERKLIKTLSDTDFAIEQLDIGDILFRRGDDILLVIERKTVKDLKASICDGRGREQKARLIGTFPKQRIMYLVEGTDLNKPLDSKIGGLPISTIVSSMINTQLRDNIRVYKSSGLLETAGFLLKMREKLEKDGEGVLGVSNDSECTISAVEYSSTLKKSKKANMTSEVWFISHLALIPQVTEKISSVIMEVYPTAASLICKYESTPEHLRSKILEDITFPLKNGKSRRIGGKISTRIYSFYYGK